MKLKNTLSILTLFSVVTLLNFSIQAADATESSDKSETIEIRIKEHLFDKTEVKVKAGQKFKLIIHNDDAQVEEFESKKLGVEKMVKGKSSLTLKLGPLKPGKYDFVGEFHEATAKGSLIAE